MPSEKSLSYSTKLEKEPFEQPPPYTSSDTASFSTTHQEATSSSSSSAPSSSSSTHQLPNQYPEAHSSPSPPDYDTLYAQHGFFGSNNNNDDSFNRKGKASTRGQQQPAGTSDMGGFRYDFNRGPIGNVVGLASNIVEYAANRVESATNRALDAADASHSARNTSGSARAVAIGIVGDFLKAKKEKQNEYMRTKSLCKKQKCAQKGGSELKHEQKHCNEPACERERGQESSNRKSNAYGRQQANQAHQEYGGSSSASSASSASSSSSRQEHGGSSSFSSPQDSKNLHIKRSNEPFTFNQSWSGEECFMQTSNGHLSIGGSLTASDQIRLETSNANITVQGQLKAKNSITVKTRNGVFSSHGPSISTKKLHIDSINAPLLYDKCMEAQRMELKCKNAPIRLSTVCVGSALSAKTSNASIEIHITDIKSDSATIKIESSNAPVHVHVPSTFSGHFSVKTSSGASASVVVTNRERCKLKFETEEQGKKEGSCKQKPGNKSNIQIIIQTSNAPATLYI